MINQIEFENEIWFTLHSMLQHSSHAFSTNTPMRKVHSPSHIDYQKQENQVHDHLDPHPRIYPSRPPSRLLALSIARTLTV